MFDAFFAVIFVAALLAQIAGYVLWHSISNTADRMQSKADRIRCAGQWDRMPGAINRVGDN